MQQASRPPRPSAQPLNGEVEEEAATTVGGRDEEADAEVDEDAAGDAAMHVTPPAPQHKCP